MRNNREDTGRHDRHLRELIGALQELDTQPALDLALRLKSCRSARIARRGDMVSALRWGYRCRSVACWACARSRVKRKAGTVMRAFAEADNKDCSLLTVCLSRVLNLEALSQVVRDVRKDVRNTRDRCAIDNRRWHDVSLCGAVEVDAVGPEDVILLPPQRRALVPQLPIIGEGDGSVWWLPHIHLSVHHPALDRSELLQVFRTRYPGPCRVDLKPFYAETQPQDGFTAAEVNAFYTASYALVQVCETVMTDPYGRDRAMSSPWPLAWQAAYFAWLHQCGRSLQSLQVMVKAKQARLVEPSTMKPTYDVEPMPYIL